MIKISRMIENCPLCGDDVNSMHIEYSRAHVTNFECVCKSCSTEFRMYSYDWEKVDAIDKFNKRPGQPKNFFVGVGTSGKESEQK